MKQPIHTTSNNTDLSAGHDHSTSTYTCKSLSVLFFNKLSIFPSTLCSSLCVSLVPFLSLSTNSLSFQTHCFSSSPPLKLSVFPSILSVPLSLFQQTLTLSKHSLSLLKSLSPSPAFSHSPPSLSLSHTCSHTHACTHTHSLSSLHPPPLHSHERSSTCLNPSALGGEAQAVSERSCSKGGAALL